LRGQHGRPLAQGGAKGRDKLIAEMPRPDRGKVAIIDKKCGTVLDRVAAIPACAKQLARSGSVIPARAEKNAASAVLSLDTCAPVSAPCRA
jgi:hypothetical protein